VKPQDSARQENHLRSSTGKPHLSGKAAQSGSSCFVDGERQVSHAFFARQPRNIWNLSILADQPNIAPKLATARPK